MKSISLGQYYAVDSPIHRIDPRFKIILSVVYIVAVFLCSNIASVSLLLLSAIILIVLSRIPFRLILRSLKPIVFIVTFTAILNIFWSIGEGAPLFEWKFIKIYKEGIINALFLIVRIVTLVIGSSVLMTYTTTPISLTDGIESLFSPLKKIKVPVHDFAMIMTIALRFIPTLSEEAEKIMAAQKARGADFTNGSLLKRAKALIPILIPLFSSSIRHAVDLATAMECRCYRGGEGRTRMKVLKSTPSDFVSLGLMLAFMGLVICTNIFLAKYLPF